jgi:hypothetical protein
VCAGETLTANTAVNQYQDTIIPKGTKLTLGVNWSTTSTGLNGSADIPGDDTTQVGTVVSAINIACDDTGDFFVDSSSSLPFTDFNDTTPPGVAVPETFQEDEPAVPTGADSDAFLEPLFPPSSIFTKKVRYEADVNFVTLGNNFPVNLTTPVSLNAVVMEATFSSARASVTVLGGDANAPSTQLVLCLDSAQTSVAELDSDAGIVTPAVAGLYANWTTYISAAGLRDESSQQLGYVTNCKHIGGAVADNDNDCLSDADDAQDSDNDQDSDGLIDGIDRAYVGANCGATPPEQIADCDGDDKTDAEEMLQTSQGLTNPRVADSDGDGLNDSGLILDCDGNGAPDSVNAATDTSGNAAGRNRVVFNVVYCKPNETSGGLGGRPVGNPGSTEDNCPTIANPAQTNTSSFDKDLDVAPDPDNNGRFGGAADNTHPDVKPTGDACDGDDDNDGIPDLVEDQALPGSKIMHFNGAATPAGGAFCNTTATGVLSDTDPVNRDTDGDGSIDGVECQLGRNPADGASKPGASMTPEETTFFRLQGLTQPAGPALASIDDGSTVGGVPESRGMGAGAGAVNDHDRDGCADETEIVDGDGNRVAGDSDRLGIARAVLGVGTFAPAGSANADLEERRTADVDFNGALGDPDRLAAARVVLTAGLPAVPDYNLSCSAATIGYAAN